MLHQILARLEEIHPLDEARAHCDVPCGIYDPITALIPALTVVRMIDLMKDLDGKNELSKMEYHNSMTRYILVKEEHAEKAKSEVRVIWGDFLKAQHLEKYPKVHELVHRIMQLGSRVRQAADREAGEQLVEAINEFALIFWDSKGIATKRVKAPYAPALEIVLPAL
jgi:nickel superoxide dismutase